MDGSDLIKNLNTKQQLDMHINKATTYVFFRSSHLIINYTVLNWQSTGNPD